MNTLPTHLVINAAIEKKYGKKANIAKSAFLWGSVMPDIPLALLSLGFILYNRYVSAQPVSGMMNSAFDNLYFNNPWWIASHNFLHSPTALIIYAILLWRFVDKIGTRGHWWLSFVFGCMVHSVIDILTHFNDGPVLFFPFDWYTRFHSPISYWDKAHYASQFVYFEVGLNLVLIGYLFLPKLIRRVRKIFPADCFFF
ncbi:MAG: metal-dependent hydrolase [Chloroflexi bacterium]|nr:metal-dependent hydrolase [Chloroflexota bacterium]